MRLIILLFVSFVSFSCSTAYYSKKKKETTAYQNLSRLEQELVNIDLTLNISAAKGLYNNSIVFLTAYPNSKYKEQVLVLASKSTDGLNMNQENLELIDQLLNEFPNSKNAPNYLYNKGKIVEEKIKDLDQALLIYQKLIETYPKSELAASLKSYIGFMNKSEKEKLEYLLNE